MAPMSPDRGSRYGSEDNSRLEDTIMRKLAQGSALSHPDYLAKLEAVSGIVGQCDREDVAWVKNTEGKR